MSPPFGAFDLAEAGFFVCVGFVVGREEFLTVQAVSVNLFAVETAAFNRRKKFHVARQSFEFVDEGVRVGELVENSFVVVLPTVSQSRVNLRDEIAVRVRAGLEFASAVFGDEFGNGDAFGKSLVLCGDVLEEVLLADAVASVVEILATVANREVSFVARRADFRKLPVLEGERFAVDFNRRAVFVDAFGDRFVEFAVDAVDRGSVICGSEC